MEGIILLRALMIMHLPFRKVLVRRLNLRIDSFELLCRMNASLAIFAGYLLDHLRND